MPAAISLPRSQCYYFISQRRCFAMIYGRLRDGALLPIRIFGGSRATGARRGLALRLRRRLMAGAAAIFDTSAIGTIMMMPR